jgi:CO/xanthine dehydrogenase Mo-binding subunit
MPMHDWMRVEAGIYHDFHHEWISAIKKTLNKRLLSSGYYAMAEQHAAGFGPDVLTLQDVDPASSSSSSGIATLQKPTKPQPKSTFYAETASEFYQRKKSSVVVRHVSGDRIVAMIEIISPGNKSSQNAFHAFVNKASELIEHRIHLLLLDPFPPGRRDPNGIHAAIWSNVDDENAFQLPAEKPLTMVAYECDEYGTRAYIEPIAVGDQLPEMPLYLEPHDYVIVPLEETYLAAWDTVPTRWQRVIAPVE